MERTLLSITALAGALAVSAQLPPTTDAPLYRHMVEVNKEWRTMDPALEHGDRPVHFASETERIAMHLRLVRDYLKEHTPAGLPISSAEQRTSLLTKLGAYAERGRFPRNEVLPSRNPVFIDRYGTACAVGQLMIESGHRDLAERIHAEINLAYVHDMKRNDVNMWASDHGFSENELAWIQPGYPASEAWPALGGGTNGHVSTLLTLANGDLLVAGEFTHAGGTVVNNVARYDGAIFHPYGAGVSGQVETAIEYDGSIWLGGSFAGGSEDLARWNGTTWVMSAAFASKYAEVHELHIHNGLLHAAGSSSGFAGTDELVKVYQNGGWSVVGNSLNGPIHALESFNGQLVCGGDFTGVFGFGTPDSSIQHVAVLDGNAWSQYGDGLNASVHDMLVMNDHLYAGGGMIANIAIQFGLARMAAGASTWEQLMPNLETYISGWLGSSAFINALQVVNNELYFAGQCAIDGIMYSGQQVGKWSGIDAVQAVAVLNSGVDDLALLGDGELVAGGSFTMNNGIEAPFLASTQLALGLPLHDLSNATLDVWPNPAIDRLNIAFPNAIAHDARIEVLDPLGRTVVERDALNATRAGLDVEGLSSGTYVVKLIDDNNVRTASFIKK